MPHKAHQVHAVHDPGAVQLRALRAVRHGAAQGVQGQTHAQVHQEVSGRAHMSQEEAGRAEQRSGRLEEGSGQEGLIPSLCPINVTVAQKKKKSAKIKVENVRHSSLVDIIILY